MAGFFRSCKPMKTTIRLILTLLASVCLCLAAPKTPAVVPPPDGGYPRGNTAEGQNALFSLTTGGVNTAGGFCSLMDDRTGGFQTPVGGAALLHHNPDSTNSDG